MKLFSTLTLLLTLGFGLSAFGQNSNELEAKLKRTPGDMRLRLQLAKIEAEQEKFEKVIELLNPYTDQLSDDGFLLLASSYSARKDFANEVRVLKILATQDENNFRWHMLLGQAYLKQANQRPKNAEDRADLFTAAIQELRKTLQLNKKFKPAYDLLLNTMLQQRAHNEARELLIEGIRKFGPRPELFRELCRLDSTDGFLVQAIDNCRTSIKLSPKYPDHYVYLVQALHDQQEDVLAERNITSAAKRFPKSEFVQWAAGTVFLRKKNFPVAQRYFEAALAAKPDESRSIFGLAQALFESGSETKALDLFIKACKMDATTLDSFLSAAGRLKQKGELALGNKYMQAANNCR